MLGGILNVFDEDDAYDEEYGFDITVDAKPEVTGCDKLAIAVFNVGNTAFNTKISMQ